jgi:hypothetical protein
MGVTICSKHGKSGFRETCEHVDAEFRMGHYKQFHRLEFLNMLVCDGCWEKYDFARLEHHPDIAGKRFYEADEDSPMVKAYENIYDKLNRRCWCVKCIAELQTKFISENS